MKRVLFDHNVPAKLARHLKAFDVKLADGLGWSELKNGKLLQAAEEEGFEVLLTADQSIPSENEISDRKIGLTCMSANSWRIVRDYVPEIVEALHKCKPGQVLPVFCGRFVASKFRKLGLRLANSRSANESVVEMMLKKRRGEIAQHPIAP